jgi:hypothetical protein
MMDATMMNPMKLLAVFSYRVATRRKLFQLEPESLHQVPVLVPISIIRALLLAILLGWDHCFGTARLYCFDNGPAVVGLLATGLAFLGGPLVVAMLGLAGTATQFNSLADAIGTGLSAFSDFNSV